MLEDHSQSYNKTDSNNTFATRLRTDLNRLIDKSNHPNQGKRKLKRRYLTRLKWLITLIVIVISFIFLQAFEALLISFSMVGVSALFNLLTFYISPRKIDFSIDAYVTIIISYMIALVKLVIIPLDISASLSVTDDISTDTTSTNTTSSSTITTQSIHSAIDIAWKIIYWTSIGINFLIMRFQIAYWSQGHPTIRKKILNTLKLFLKQLIVISVIGAAAILFLIFKYSSIFKSVDFIKSIIQIINNIYCLTHLLILLGYGMVELPFYFFSYTNSSVKLKIAMRSLNVIRNEMEEAVNKLLKDNAMLVEISTNIMRNKEKLPDENMDHLADFAKEIIHEIADYKFEFNDLIKYKKIEGNIKDPKFKNLYIEISDDILANMLITVKNDFYLCNKKEAALLRLYSVISQNCEVVNDVNLSDPGDRVIITGKKKRSLVMERCTSFNNNKKIAFLLPKNHPRIMIFFTKLFAFLLLSISLLLLVLQVNLYFISLINFIYKISTTILASNFYLNYFFIIFYFSYLFICCFYSISKFKLFEIYILVPHHTNRFGMAFNSSMCNTLLLGICYNLLYFYSSIYDKTTGLSSASALNDFFDSMKKVEFIYGYYNYIFPSILLIIIAITIAHKFRLACFKNSKLNDYEIDFDPLQDKPDNEVISEDTFKDLDGKEGNIKFDVLEKIQDIYYVSNCEDDKKETKEEV